MLESSQLHQVCDLNLIHSLLYDLLLKFEYEDL